MVDEWWEWFGDEGIATDRKGFIGKLIAGYDSVLEIPAKAVFDGVIAISNTLKSRLNSASNVIVLNGGAECDKFIAYDRNVARQKVNLPSDIFIVGMSNVSKDDHDDNLPFFEALGKLSKSYSHLRLLVTGDPKYVQSALKPLFPPNLLIDCGWPDFESYNRFLSACDIFGLPYPDRPRNAGRWPNKIGDYLSLNRPVITNPTGDVGVLFNDYVLGFLCGNTTEDYTRLVSDIVQNRDKMAAADFESRKVAKELLSFPKRVNRILSFYESILASSRTGWSVE
ncbi:MAG: glycosyltransferase [Desulfobacterales bacterium]|nr:glycosyltransferase [Desulfobacterales bacterium]